MKTDIRSLLYDLDLCSDSTVEEYHPRVRDRDDISVLRCVDSNVIFLSSVDHIDTSYYRQKRSFQYWSATTREQAVAATYRDDKRRSEQFHSLIENKIWLDVGTGVGGMLDLLGPVASEVIAVEPQDVARDSLTIKGYETFASVDAITRQDLEVVTLFHVFEHLRDPIETLKSLIDRMKLNSIIVIEVPHAKDILLSEFNLESFKDFTFWSEHLILHTRRSLELMLKRVGFKNINIEGFQRYPLENHLHWLAEGKPNGHLHYNHLHSSSLNRAYSEMLEVLDMTDTLIATATK